jgi:hypothetical protein
MLSKAATNSKSILVQQTAAKALFYRKGQSAA